MSHESPGRPTPPPTVSDLSAPVALQHLMMTYQITQAIYTATQLGVAELLADGPKSAKDLAQATGTHGPSLSRLLRALVAYGVFDEGAPDQFALTSLGTCLRKDAPNSVRDGVLMWGSPHYWQTTADLLYCVQTGESAISHLFGTATSFEYYRTHPEVGAMMHAGWAAAGRIRAEAVLGVYDFSASGILVDVGGNRGQLLAPILHAYPSVQGVLYDLPHVVEEAAPFLERAGVADRCTLVGGDIFTAVPAGGDTYLLSMILHDWDDAKAITILRNCHRAMPPHATLLLVERVLPTPLDQSVTTQQAVIIDLIMLLMTGGRERTQAEYAALLAAAGFALERIIPTQAGYSLVQSTANIAASATGAIAQPGTPV